MKQKIKKFFIDWYYSIRYFLAVSSPIHVIVQLEFATQTKMPFDYTWDEKYLYRIEWLKRRSNGIDCTFKEVEKEFLDGWWRQFEETKKKFEESRKKN